VEEQEKSKVASNVAGDGGLMWLKRAFQRAKEQAKEEGKPLEEIVSMRWGVSADLLKPDCMN